MGYFPQRTLHTQHRLIRHILGRHFFHRDVSLFNHCVLGYLTGRYNHPDPWPFGRRCWALAGLGSRTRDHHEDQDPGQKGQKSAPHDP